MIVASCVGEREQKIPLSSGIYQFEHRDAEFPAQPGFPVTLTVSSFHYTVAVRNPGQSIAMCPLDEGTLMWNQKLNVWVLGHQESGQECPARRWLSGRRPRYHRLFEENDLDMYR